MEHDPPSDHPRTWWTRPGLEVSDGRLRIAGRDAAALAAAHGTPLYVYDLEHVREQVRAVSHALAATGLPYRVRFALKSQRDPGVLRTLRELGSPGAAGSVGMDVCSPAETTHALANGWLPEEISYTGTNLSDADLDAILAHEVHVNVDLLSQLDRFGRHAPGRSVGLRINPQAGAAHRYVPAGRSQDDELRFGVYAGARPTKFGVYAHQLDAALEIAARHGTIIDTVHFHLSHQMLGEDLPAYEAALAATVPMVGKLAAAGCPIVEVNTGGGLGTPLRQGDAPLDLAAWAAVLARYLGPLGVTVAVEPGEFFTKLCGITLAQVVTVDDRLGTTFVGLDVGWNAVPLRFVWGEHIEIVHCAAADAPRRQTVTVSGHINEAPDVFAEDYPFPAVAEGDVVALIGTGAYCQSVVSPHCLRPAPAALLLEDRLQS